MTYRAVVSIGKHGSWCKTGFKTRLGAKLAALKMVEHWLKVQPGIDVRAEEPEDEGP